MRSTLLVLIIAAVALAGCQDKPKTEAPTNQQAADQMPAGHPPIPGGTEQGAKGEDPHAGLKAMAIPQGVPTKSGKVLEVLDGGQYIYLNVQHDDNSKMWVAALPMKVAKDDKVKYVDSPAMPNFPSKTLNRTFDQLVLTQAVEVVK